METASLALAQPITVAGVTLRNRIVMAPMSTNYGHADGKVSDRTFDYYEERARGGVGAIVVEALAVDPRSKILPGQLFIHDESFIPGLSDLVHRVHAGGARIFAQLCHGGPKTVSAFSGTPALSASEVPIKFADVPRPMTRGEIAGTIESFASAALLAREAGFDGVELHGGHFYLISAFLSGHLNRRTDEYGGSLENRARLYCEVIRAVKAAAGDAYPVLCRFNGREDLAGGIDVAEARRIARLLVGAGADALDVSAAIYPVGPRITHLYSVKAAAGVPIKEAPPGCHVEFAAAVKQVVDVPVIAVGKLNDPAVAERVLRDGEADLIAIGRGLIADPYLPAKAVSGRWDEITRCKECLTCHATLQRQKPMNCEANPKPWARKGPAEPVGPRPGPPRP